MTDAIDIFKNQIAINDIIAVAFRKGNSSVIRVGRVENIGVNQYGPLLTVKWEAGFSGTTKINADSTRIVVI